MDAAIIMAITCAIVIGFGIWIIIIGTRYNDKSFIEKHARTVAANLGVKSNITEETYAHYRRWSLPSVITGIFLIILGILLAVFMIPGFLRY